MGWSCLSGWFNSRTTGRIRMKSGMCVVPFGGVSKSFFLILYDQ
jgi:hypothetical protein